MFVYTSGIKHLEDIICNVLGRMPPVLCEELLVSMRRCSPHGSSVRQVYDVRQQGVLSRDLNHRQAALVSKIAH